MKLYALLLSLVIPLGAAAADGASSADTVKATPKAAPEQTKNNDYDPEETDVGKFKFFFGNFYAGWGKAALDGYDISMRRIDEIGMLNTAAVGYKFRETTRLSLGVGFNHRRYTLMKGYHFTQGESDVIGIEPFQPGLSRCSSKINLWQIRFPLMLRQEFAGNGAFSLAAVLDWNCHASFTNASKEGDTRTSSKTGVSQHRKVTVDALAAVSWNYVGIYFNFAPMSVFKKDCGPEIKNAWTFGLMLLL